jgi:hypothetical protein
MARPPAAIGTFDLADNTLRIRGLIDRYVFELKSKDVIALAQHAAKERTLTLVAGAGLSTGAGIPGWSSLISGLFHSVYDGVDSKLGVDALKGVASLKLGNLEQVRHLEAILGFSSELRSMIRNRLYEQLTEENKAKLLETVVDLFLRSEATTTVKHVVTYNYDNLIERRLRRLGETNFHSIYSNRTYPLRGGGLRIYHPHGFIPHPEDDPNDEVLEQGIVLSEGDYHAHYLDSGHWANVVQMHHFMNRICLFVGLSMSDPNLRRLLNHAFHKTGRHHFHACVMRARSTPLENFILEKDLESLGVRVIWVADYADIPAILELCVCKA